MVMRGVLLAVVLLTHGAVASAQDEIVYLGAGWSAGKAKSEQEADGAGYFSEHYRSRAQDLKLGFLISESSRLELSHSRITLRKDGYKQRMVSSDADWIITGSQTEITPYITLGLGVSQYQDLPLADTSSLDGWALNIGAGLLFRVNERLELDIGYHEKRMFWESADVAGQQDRLKLSTTLSQFTGAVHVLF